MRCWPRPFARGARAAEAGEFTLRAFLNDKIDLLQAEAIADLVASGSAQAARAALRSLDGEFSAAVAELQAALTTLRVRIEAWLDFPDEELPFDAAPECAAELAMLVSKLDAIATRARSGRALRDGLDATIAGPPNAGKSSLLNRLAGYDAAIVTEIPGTTRDPLREQLTLDGLPVTVVDTAGLRDTNDPIEREGVRRARLELKRADRLLWVADARDSLAGAIAAARAAREGDAALTVVANKIDLAGGEPRVASEQGATVVYVSALTGVGIDLLVAHAQGNCRRRRRQRWHVQRAAPASRRARACARASWRCGPRTRRCARARGRAFARRANRYRRADGRANERRLARRDLRDVLHRQIARRERLSGAGSACVEEYGVREPARGRPPRAPRIGTLIAQSPLRRHRKPVFASLPPWHGTWNAGVMEKGIDKCLATLRNWAERRVRSGGEPPWAWYQYMKLIETVAAIQIGRASVSPSTVGSLAVEPPTAPPRPKADAVADIGRRRRRRRREDPPLPM